MAHNREKKLPKIKNAGHSQKLPRWQFLLQINKNLKEVNQITSNQKSISDMTDMWL